MDQKVEPKGNPPKESSWDVGWEADSGWRLPVEYLPSEHVLVGDANAVLMKNDHGYSTAS